MTLSDADKQRIAEEEKERLKVREQLKNEEDTKKAAQKKKTTKFALIGCGGLIALIVIIAIIIGASSSKTTDTQTIPTYTGPEVIYEITGTAMSADVTLSNATGGTEQFSNIQWSHVTGAPGYEYTYESFPASFLYISAQNQGESGSVTVNIYYEGNLIKTSTSTGAYVIATASARK